MPRQVRQVGQPDGRFRTYHVLVVLLSLVLIFVAWFVANRQSENRVLANFQDARDRTLSLIVDRMEQYEDALWSGVAAIESHGGDMTEDQWRRFAKTLGIEQRYPGIGGIGVIHFLKRPEAEAYLEDRRRERETFQIYPKHPHATLMPITFIEPVATNFAALGLDIAHETQRRTAALASRYSGRARITGPIVLVQDTGARSGFLFMAPFADTTTANEGRARNERASGLVYAPFIVEALMEGLLAKERRSVHLSIADSREVIHDEHGPDTPMHDPDPMFQETVALDLYGRVWTIDIRTNLVFRDANYQIQPTLLLIAGLLIEALIIALLVLMTRANRRAIAYADHVTTKLRRQTARVQETNCKLEAANAELEQFTYITSHDLKTPIRGIAGLTELIEEDLSDYLASEDSNPDVAQNLGLIRERVARMSALTRAIIEYSRLGADGHDAPPLDLAETVAAMRSDFGLSGEELTLQSDVSSIGTDSNSLRRVFENLVGNAVKYHHEREALRIHIRVELAGHVLRISVSDNGPGIEDRFHDRIFDVFQTLRVADAPESTGIGLAMVKKAVERHGGRVTLTSAPGDGSTFAFDWPGKDAAETGAVERAAA